jgi:hypothetical protein
LILSMRQVRQSSQFCADGMRSHKPRCDERQCCFHGRRNKVGVYFLFKELDQNDTLACVPSTTNTLATRRSTSVLSKIMILSSRVSNKVRIFSRVLRGYESLGNCALVPLGSPCPGVLFSSAFACFSIFGDFAARFWKVNRFPVRFAPSSITDS